MSTQPINMALYRWMRKNGADDAEAEAASRIDTTDLATRADLAQLKAELIMWGIGVGLTLSTLQTGLLLFAMMHYKP